MRNLLVLFVLLVAPVLAQPKWQTLAPAGQSFRCDFPPGKIAQNASGGTTQWQMIVPGKYGFLLGLAPLEGGAATFMTGVLKSAKITEKSRKSIKHQGLDGLESVGTMNPSGVTLHVRVRVFTTPKQTYSLVSMLPSAKDKAATDRFFASFRLTK